MHAIVVGLLFTAVSAGRTQAAELTLAAIKRAGYTAKIVVLNEQGFSGQPIHEAKAIEAHYSRGD